MKIKLILLTLSTSFLWITSASAKEGKVASPIEGAEHLVYKEASGSKLILNVFYPEGHDPKKAKTCRYRPSLMPWLFSIPCTTTGPRATDMIG